MLLVLRSRGLRTVEHEPAEERDEAEAAVAEVARTGPLPVLQQREELVDGEHEGDHESVEAVAISLAAGTGTRRRI